MFALAVFCPETGGVYLVPITSQRGQKRDFASRRLGMDRGAESDPLLPMKSCVCRSL